MRPDFIVARRDARPACGVPDPARVEDVLAALRAAVRERDEDRDVSARRSRSGAGPLPGSGVASAARARQRSRCTTSARWSTIELRERPVAGSTLREALRLFAISASLGSTESLVQPGQLMRPRDLTRRGARVGGVSATDTVRLSIGIEGCRRPDRRPGAGARRVQPEDALVHCRKDAPGAFRPSLRKA